MILLKKTVVLNERNARKRKREERSVGSDTSQTVTTMQTTAIGGNDERNTRGAMNPVAARSRLMMGREEERAGRRSIVARGDIHTESTIARGIIELIEAMMTEERNE
jgi:hypothetical protein